MTQIIPAILATTEEEYKEKLNLISQNQSLKDSWVQIDLMDNKFVQNQSIGLDILKKYPFSNPKEGQLMVDNPSDWIDQLAKMGFKTIIFPLEINGDIGQIIKTIKDSNINAGVSINPETETRKLHPFLDMIDMALVMSVHPGFEGQKFIPQSVHKVKELAHLRAEKGLKYQIEVDGGINEAMVRQLVEAGADRLVIGSHLLKGDIDENLEQIWQAIRG